MRAAANGGVRTAGDEARFDRDLARLVGIVEPDRVRPAQERPSSAGWFARFIRSRRGSVAIGFAIATMIVGVAVVGLNALLPPVGEPASVTLAIPALDRPVPAPEAQPLLPVPVMLRGDDPRDAGSQEGRAGGSTSRPTQLATVRRDEVARPAITPMPRASASPAPALQVTPDARPSARPVMVAAVDRSVAGRPGMADPDVAPVVSAPPDAPIDRRETPAVRVERRDNVDALRQLRHQW